MRNTYFSEGRTRRREVPDSDGAIAAKVQVAAAQQWHLELQDLRKALELMPSEQREALLLVGAAGMSYQEAAEIAQVAIGTVKSRVNRARSKLAGLLGIGIAEATDPVPDNLD